MSQQISGFKSPTLSWKSAAAFSAGAIGILTLPMMVRGKTTHKVAMAYLGSTGAMYYGASLLPPSVGNKPWKGR